jgi:hypothetical protein
VKEAIEYADKAIEDAKRRGDTTINIIVGPSFSIQWSVFGLADVRDSCVQVKGCIPAAGLPS